MTTFRTSLLAATVLALPLALLAPAAQAQPVSGLYVAAGAGLNWLGNQTHSAQSDQFLLGGEGGPAAGPAANAIIIQETASVSGQVRSSSRLGFVGVASLGWGFGNGLRAELEGSWRSNTIHGGPVSGAAVVDGTTYPFDPSFGNVRGRTDQYAVMVNALYDFNIGQSWIYPYVGVGVGYSWQRFTGLNVLAVGLLNGSQSTFAGLEWSSNDTVGRFAYQAIAGAAFPIASVPGLSVTAEYRFLGTVGTERLDAKGGALVVTCLTLEQCGGFGNVTRARVTAPHNHSILLGLRYAFNAAPAAVMAPVVAPAGKSFLVFFDWDKSTLTDRARGIIREAAATSKTTQHTRVEVNGYADTSGNAKYNQGISMRRAQTVAAELAVSVKRVVARSL